MESKDTKKIKVVTTGRDAITDAIFNIVKIGVYTVDREGFLDALRDGIYDKYEKEPPRFECLSFDKVDEYTRQDRHNVVFVFACREFDTDEEEVSTIISGKVTFIRIV